MARRGASPVRANSSLVPRGVETTAATIAAPSGDDVDASCGPSVVLRSVWTSPGEAGASPPLAHTRRSRAHILTASATTIHDKGDGTGSGRFPDSFVIPGNPSTEQSGQIAWGSHERKRETTARHFSETTKSTPVSPHQSRNDERKPCGTAAMPRALRRSERERA